LGSSVQNVTCGPVPSRVFLRREQHDVGIALQRLLLDPALLARCPLDEVGCRPGRREVRLMALEHLLSARDVKGSTLSRRTTTLRDSTELFAGDDILTAILDRFLDHVHLDHIGRRSYLLRELNGLLSTATKTSC
jgi:hypothetical protein